MSTADTDLHIGHRPSIPHDDSRRIIADGWVRRQDDGLMAELTGAMRVIPGEDTAKTGSQEAWRIHQQQGGGTA